MNDFSILLNFSHSTILTLVTSSTHNCEDVNFARYSFRELFKELIMIKTLPLFGELQAYTICVLGYCKWGGVQ